MAGIPEVGGRLMASRMTWIILEDVEHSHYSLECEDIVARFHELIYVESVRVPSQFVQCLLSPQFLL